MFSQIKSVGRPAYFCLSCFARTLTTATIAELEMGNLACLFGVFFVDASNRRKESFATGHPLFRIDLNALMDGFD